MELSNPNTLRAFLGKGKRMTGRELARYVGVHPSTIDHLAQGRMKTCTPQLANDIEKVLGVPQGTIFLRRESNAAIRKPSTENKRRATTGSRK